MMDKTRDITRSNTQTTNFSVAHPRRSPVMQIFGLELIGFMRYGYRPVIQEDITGVLINGGNSTKVCGEVNK